MNKKRLIALFCMFLIISLPLCLAVDEFEERGESLIIQAKKYQPTVLRTDIVESGNAYVHIVLGAMRGTAISVPDIRRVNVQLIKESQAQKEGASVKGTSSEARDWIQGSPKFIRAKFPTIDNLGYIEVRLKEIPKEHEVPEKLNLDFKATIKYEAEKTQLTIGGENLLELKQATRQTVEDQKEKHSILGGKAYLRLVSIKGKEASFEILDPNFEYLDRVSGLEEGEISKTIDLERDTAQPESVRLKLEEIKGEGAIKIEVKGEERSYEEDEDIGGGWKVDYVTTGEDARRTDDDYIILTNKDYTSKVILTKEEDFDSIEDLKGKTCTTPCHIYTESVNSNIKKYTVEKEDFERALQSLDNLGVSQLKTVESKQAKRFTILERGGIPSDPYYVGDTIGQGGCSCEIYGQTT